MCSTATSDLGQIFTPSKIALTMKELIRNCGRVLEPSAGSGNISNLFDSIVAIELDESIACNGCIVMDFMDYPIYEKFDTIIGNPPYVAYKNIYYKTKYHLTYSANLYIHFIDKLLNHLSDFGEMILITPRDFIKATGAVRINNRLYNEGTITHFYEYGDSKVFDDASPNVVIWRFEKNNFSHITHTNTGSKTMSYNNGQLYFDIISTTSSKFSDYFFVKVGGASGADSLFTHTLGNEEFVVSSTKKDNKTRRMFYNVYHQELLPHKYKLLNRRLRQFNESNWFMWGRNYFKSNLPRIYVNSRTRDSEPFFLHNSNAYDGSILAVFPKVSIDLEFVKHILNTVYWDNLGFKVGGRLIFTQRSLETVMLPDNIMHTLEREIK